MSRESNVHLGSGTTPTLRLNPGLSGVLSEDIYPPGNVRANFQWRQGENAVILNPEDFSIRFGIRSQSITINDSSPIALPVSPLEKRRALVIDNNSSVTIYIGQSDITSANGYPLRTGASIAIDIQGHVPVWIYAISDSGDADVRILELS